MQLRFLLPVLALALAVVGQVPKHRDDYSHRAPAIIGHILEYRDDNSDELSTASNASMLLRRTAPGFFDDDTAQPDDWDRYTAKGGGLLCGLMITDRAAGEMLKDGRNPPSAASEWQGGLEEELKTWYWHQLDDDQRYCDIAKRWELGYALKSLGLNEMSKKSGGDNECYSFEHQARAGPAINQFYKVDGKEYRATGAHYIFAVNRKGGAIYCFYLTSPASAARSNWYGNQRDADVNDLPKLRRLSDILWGVWTRDNPDVKDIRYFFMVGISNDMTNQIMASALKNTNKKLREWPGTKYSTTSDEGKALLGSPNGAAFAYFLMQHKKELGYKTISDVTITRPENDDDNDFVDATLVFHVADVPEPPADPLVPGL